MDTKTKKVVCFLATTGVQWHKNAQTFISLFVQHKNWFPWVGNWFIHRKTKLINLIIIILFTCDIVLRLLCRNVDPFFNKKTWQLILYPLTTSLVPEALGGYLLFNTYNNHVQSGMEHVFLSPALQPFTKYCVSFWYYMPNNESRLQLTAVFDNGSRQLLWKQENQKTNSWTKVKVAVDGNTYFRVSNICSKSYFNRIFLFY